MLCHSMPRYASLCLAMPCRAIQRFDLTTWSVETINLPEMPLMTQYVRHAIVAILVDAFTPGTPRITGAACRNFGAATSC